MLIAICGPQGCGKSTTITGISEAMSDCRVVSRKTSRSIMSDWGISFSDVCNDVRLSIKFQDEMLTRKLNDDASGINIGVTVTERTPIDLAAYAICHVGRYNEHTDWLNEYVDKCVSSTVSMYNKIFTLTPLDCIECDGVRPTNHHFGSTINDTMLSLYKYGNIDSITIDSTSMYYRINRIIEEVLCDNVNW